MAGEMVYLTDHRGDLRADPRNLLPEAKSIVCLGKIYNAPEPRSIDVNDPKRGWISRYAWGGDYHEIMRELLLLLVRRIEQVHSKPFEWRICVDTAPLLERSYARAAGLGWIGRNTCLINQEHGSWFFLGELLLSLELAFDSPPPDRCGTCRRCIDACPTDAIVATATGEWALDARACISYWTIEKRGPLQPGCSEKLGNHLFGCDICQDVCPWNSRPAITSDTRFQARDFAPILEDCADFTEEQFREQFRGSPVLRAKYSGFLRNVAAAMGNSGQPEMRDTLVKLTCDPNETVAETAKKALNHLDGALAATKAQDGAACVVAE